METIFDHNPTKEELKKMFGNPNINPDLFLELKQEDNYVGIYKLYLLRGNQEKWVEYLNKIPDCEEKWFSVANHDYAILNTD